MEDTFAQSTCVPIVPCLLAGARCGGAIYHSNKTKTFKIGPVIPEIITSEGLTLVVVIPKLGAVSVRFASFNSVVT